MVSKPKVEPTPGELCPMAPNSSLAKKKIHDQPKPAHGQRQSPLFSRLPYDIRILIYYQLILDFGPVRHIYNDYIHSKCWSIRCLAPPTPDEERENPVKHRTDHRNCTEYFRGPLHNSTHIRDIESPGTSLVAALRTCKRISSELTHIIFTFTTFRFASLITIHKFLSSLPHHHLNAIKHIHFFLLIRRRGVNNNLRHYDAGSAETTWEALCRVLSTMASLAELKIIVKNFKTIEPVMLAPLWQIANVERFVVELDCEEGWEPEAGAPFEVKRLA